MDKREASKTETSDLEALLRTWQAAGLVESRVVGGEVQYRITEFGRAIPKHAWMDLAAPNVGPQ
jgi:hypothetical protein